MGGAVARAAKGSRMAPSTGSSLVGYPSSQYPTHERSPFISPSPYLPLVSLLRLHRGTGVAQEHRG
jgi:hypothetical protein